MLKGCSTRCGFSGWPGGLAASTGDVKTMFYALWLFRVARLARPLVAGPRWLQLGFWWLVLLVLEATGCYFWQFVAM